MPGLTPAPLQAFGGSRRIADREDDYRRRRLNRVISPARNDAFTTVRQTAAGGAACVGACRAALTAPGAQGDKTPDASVRTYADVMREQQLARERDTTLRALADKQKESYEAGEAARRAAALDASRPTKSSGMAPPALPPPSAAASEAGDKRRNRWDASGAKPTSDWESEGRGAQPLGCDAC
jgi:splicing factor 3B subunit 1